MPLSSKLHASLVPQEDLALNRKGKAQMYGIETGDSTWPLLGTVDTPFILLQTRLDQAMNYWL